jgi:hypothetical protein
MAEMSNFEAMQKFFSAEPHGRKVTMEEAKKLSQEERQELGDLCRAALNA